MPEEQVVQASLLNICRLERSARIVVSLHRRRAHLRAVKQANVHTTAVRVEALQEIVSPAWSAVSGPP